MTDYDVVVIGAGPVGENVADRAVRGGLTAVIVESELVGGECSYWACMPSKALLRPVAAVSEATHLKGVHGAQLDPPGVLDRRDSFASHWNDDGQVKWLNGAHIGLVRGRGRLTGPKTVSVSPAEGPPLELRARQAVVVATGTRAAVPPIPGLAEARPWTSREATSAHEVPRRLAIIGGGVVGSEMACAWQSLGAQVTLAVREERLLDRMEHFAGTMVADGLAALGADVRCGVDVVSVARPQPGGPVTLTLDDQTTVEADEVLAATGREPHTDDLGLETVGLKPGGWLDVDGALPGHQRRRRLAVRRGRRQPHLAADPHGQIPGADLRGRDRRPGPRPHAGQHGLGRPVGRAPGDLHHAGSGLGGPDVGRGRRGGPHHPGRGL